MSKNKWKVLSKKGKNFENFFISLLAVGFTDPKIKKEDPTELIASKWLQASGNRYLLEEEFEAHKKILLKFLKEDPQVLIDAYDYYLDILNKMEASANIIPQSNFYTLDLFKYLKEWSFLVKSALRYGYNYYWLSQKVSDIILAALKRNNSQDVFSDFEVLSQAEKLSAIQMEKISLLKIIENISKNNLSLDSKDLDETIKDHLEKYAYLGQYFFRGSPWQMSDIKSRIQDLLTSDWKSEQLKFDKFIYNDNRSKEILEKYDFSNYEKNLIVLMKKMSHATNRYDEVNTYYFYKSRKLLKYITEKIGLSYEEFIEMNYDEVLDYLKNNKKASSEFIDQLIEREKDSVLLAMFGKVEIFVDKKSKNLFYKEIGEDKFENNGILRGNCASQGKARGRAVIFKSVKDLAKVKEGDIMVAVATVPAFVPAMEKSAGIITETGGLLSHAAIVSREMHVPCIVGVENITKIIKTGNLIEMDAIEGIVKVVK